jgi:hypothetical protein
VGDGTAAGICVGTTCDVIGGSGCAGANGCYAATNDGGAWISICAPRGPGVTGQGCSDFLDCAPGYTCTTANTCAQLCRPSIGSCAVGFCQAIPGAPDLGICN